MPRRKSCNANINQYDTTLKTIQPCKIDSRVTFNSIGGLEEHIKCLREMVIFPLIYQDFFRRFNTRPPKGVLFHGPPGTGKTLLARALANECNLVRGKKVAFFMRKGADVMSMWYGESEQQIRKLFQQATKMRPSIIFFDEIDSLAPIRSQCQGQVYASVVATLLVEMDGLCDRGDVIVIGATNRPDALDPALRRPGRLDRELYFPPPGVLARKDILAINTWNWLPRPNGEMLEQMAKLTPGFLGSDLNALCSEAVLRALRRVYPQIYEGDYHHLSSIDTRKVAVTMSDMLEAKRSLLPAASRNGLLVARHLPPYIEPLLGAQVEAAAEMMKQIYPAAETGYETQNGGDMSAPCVFLICGDCAETYIAPALLAQLEHCTVKELSMATLHSRQKQENAIVSIFDDCRRTERSSVIFMPNIPDIWESMHNTPGQSLLLQQWRNRAAGDNALLLATCQSDHENLPDPLQELFPSYKACVYRVRNPTAPETINFLMPILERMPSLPATSPSALSENKEHSVKDPPHAERASSSRTVTTPAPIANDSSLRKRRHPDPPRHHDVKRAKLSRESSAPASDDGFRLKELCLDISKILLSNVEYLRRLGLEALTDLHAQLSNAVAVNGCYTTRNHMQLSNELHTITVRYLKLARKC